MCYGGALHVRVVYGMLGRWTVCYGGVMYCMLGRCTVC